MCPGLIDYDIPVVKQYGRFPSFIHNMKHYILYNESIIFFSSFSVLTTAQVRPMVFPHLQSSSTPDSAVSNVASEPQPPHPEEEKPMDPPPPPPAEEGKVAMTKNCYCLIS